MATANATIGIGTLSEFDSDKEDITSYVERFSLYLIVNSIDDANIKRAVFLLSIGAKTYKLLCSLSNNNPLEKSSEQLVEHLKDHLQPMPNVIAERFKFFKQDRKPAESVSAYISELYEGYRSIASLM